MYEYGEYLHSNIAIISAKDEITAKQYLSCLAGFKEYKVDITDIEEITTIPFINGYEMVTR